ncbi:MAG TPA: arylamine N-acetyltransferase [Sandaracinaceae bacterium LLY-WYZ-13_1]|nr:arylamine N-acetyltransferase [Sandaracinaceae bacterium LLY-WYZ-13_1]
MSEAFDASAYLARVGLPRTPTADAEGLAALVEAQARAVAFENLRVLEGRPGSLGPAALFDVLVTRRRGGYCFELNGLLALALDAFGFEARPLLARVLVRREPGAPPGPRTHQVMLVRLDGAAWIADAGFGGGLPVRSMPLEAGTEHRQLGETLRLWRDDALGWLLQMRDGDGWRDLYAFGLDRVYPADLEVAHHFTATHPASPFVKSAFVSRPEGEGRIVLRGDTLTVHRPDGVRRERVAGPDARRRLLIERFGLALDRGGAAP